MLLEEWLHILHVHSVVLVGVELEGGCLKLLVAEASIVYELCVLLVVVGKAGDFAAFPRKVAQIGRAVQGAQEEETIVEHAPLGNVLKLDRIGGLHHFFLLEFNLL